MAIRPGRASSRHWRPMRRPTGRPPPPATTASGRGGSPDQHFDSPPGHPYKQRKLTAGLGPPLAVRHREPLDTETSRMANTSSARKATRQIARRTLINKSRRSRLRTAVVKIEEAIATGDRGRAQAALMDAEPVIMRAAQKGIIHKNAASRKVSRLAHRVAKLGQ